MENSIGQTVPNIEALNLTKRYEDGLLALDHINFKIEPGEIYVLLGGNGAGKTTTINLFLNFIEPTEGKAFVNGIATHEFPLKTNKHIAFVSENVMLYENFTAIQNLDFFTRLSGRKDIHRNDYRDVLLQVGLEESAHDKRLKGFSKGMRQKCGIAIAILKDANSILLDEPTSGLDPKSGHEFIHLLDTLRQDGKSILMSTHDIFRAREIADTLAIMNNGRIIMQKKSDDLAGKDLEELYMQHLAGYSEVNSVAAEV